MKRCLISMLPAILVLAVATLIFSCSPQEQPVAVSGISLDQNTLTLEIGATANLKATISPSNATAPVIGWSSSNPSVATVSNGTVTAVSAGTATITAIVGDIMAKCSVTVSSPPSMELLLNFMEWDLGIGETIEIYVMGPESIKGQPVTWTSSDPMIATVDDNGLITGVSEGTTTISASVAGLTTSSIVTVRTDETHIKELLMEFYNAMDGPNWKKSTNWGTDAHLNAWDCVGFESSTGRLWLQFRDNGLKGEIPECIGDLDGLAYFTLQNEPGVTGTLPDSFRKLVNLESCVILNTSMTSLPDVFSDMHKLYELSVWDNFLMQGPLPASAGNSPLMVNLAICRNAFTGGLPPSWARLGDKLRLYGNCLSGRIPSTYLEPSVAKYFLRANAILMQQEGYGFDLTGIDFRGSYSWPEGILEDLISGKSFNFNDVVSKNRYTVFIEWETWCPFSSVLMPQLKEYYEKYHQDGLEVIATFSFTQPSGYMDVEGQRQGVLDNGYDLWYNFNYVPYIQDLDINSYKHQGTPAAEVYDSEGNLVFSSFKWFNDPTGQERFLKTTSTDLLPFLESVIGPMDAVDDYSSKDYSQDGKVLTLQRASEGSGINIVFMGDAYTDREMASGGLYEKVMHDAMEEFFAIEPYKTFRNRFNVYAVKVVSKNGRVGTGYNTALGTSFGTGTEVFVNQDKCIEYAMKVPGISDHNLLVNVMVNSRRYSGTAYLIESLQSGVAVASTIGNDRTLFGPALRHEAGGHGFGFLDDEYSTYQTTPPQSHIDDRRSKSEQYGWFFNIDFTNDPQKVKWSEFLSDERYKDEVGIYEGASRYSKGAFRPSSNSMMNENMEYFNAPSRWAIYKRIMELSGEEANFQEFLEYDAVNRNNKASTMSLRAISKGKVEHTAPPIIVR